MFQMFSSSRILELFRTRKAIIHSNLSGCINLKDIRVFTVGQMVIGRVMQPVIKLFKDLLSYTDENNNCLKIKQKRKFRYDSVITLKSPSEHHIQKFD